MAQRFFIELSYDGTPFHGWQIQNNAKTIQQSLNEALSTVTRQEIYCVGCGRTDTGVHARQFFAHFDATADLGQLDDLRFHVNRVLPEEIAIHRIFGVHEDLHARFSATSRSYEYLITRRKNPFARHRMWEYRETLDLDAMNGAAACLKSYQDFTSFSKSNTDTNTNDCDVTHASWETNGDVLRFEITANRFLRNMVRAIVGTTFEVGLGKMNIDDFKAVIEAKDRSRAGLSVPAHGLYLIQINYPDLET